ncbi:hypothetical protein ACFV6W_29545, partial [Streptomyces sp. NPDC059802]
MTNDLGTLATALHTRIADKLKASPCPAPWRPAVGITPTPSDAELITLAVMSGGGGGPKNQHHPNPKSKGNREPKRRGESRE